MNKLCKNCTFYRKSTSIYLDKCYHPKSKQYVELIRGDVVYLTCAEMRNNEDVCGINAKLYHNEY